MDTTAAFQGLALSKGEASSLTATKDGQSTGLTTLEIGLKWDANAGGDDADCDAILIGLDANGKIISENHVLSWIIGKQQGIPQGKPFEALGGAWRHSGDERTGETEGYDEVMTCHFDKLKANAPEVKQMAIICMCYNDPAATNRLTFGNVKDASVQVWNPANPTSPDTTLHFDLTEDYGGAEAIVFGLIYDKDGEWKFRAKGEVIPNATNIAAIAKHFS
jgi:tellurium resistance protein TerD